MRKVGFKVKVFLGVIFSLIILFTGSIFYISSKISPEEIKKITLESLSKQFPNCQVELANLNFSLGFSFKFNAQNFSMRLKNQEKDGELVKISEAQISIPIWAILTGGGSIEISVSNPDFYYLMYNKDENNWKKAISGMPKKEEKPDTISSTDKKAGDANESSENPNKLKIMNFFAKSNINIKFLDIRLNTKLADGTNGQIILSRFLIKNLNLSTPTAFELASKIEMKLKNQDNLSLSTLLIGHANLNDLLKGKDLESTLRLSLEDINFSKFKEKLPNLTSDIKLTMKKEDGSILVNTGTELVNMGTIKAEVFIKDGKINISGIDVKLLIKEILRIFSPQMDQIKVGDSKLSVKGDVSMNEGKISPQLEFGFSPEMTLSVDDTLTVLSGFNGSINGKAISLNLNNKLLKGSLDIHVFTEFDLNNPVTNPESLSPINIEMVASDLLIEESLIKKKMESSKEKENLEQANSTGSQNSLASKGPSQGASKAALSPEEEKALEIREKALAPKLPTIKAKIRLSKIHIGKEEFSSNGNLFIQKNKIASDDLNFTFAKGKGNISFVLQLLDKSQKNIQWDFSLNSLNIDSLKLFMPQQIDVVNGDFSGKLKGNAKVGTRPEHLQYDVNADLSAVNGEIKGIKIGEIIKNVAENFSFLKGKTSGLNQKIDNNFEVFMFKGNLRHDRYLFNQLKFIGVNKSVEINGKGEIFPPLVNKEGQLDLDILDNTGIVSNQLEKNVGTKILPVRLKGYGFKLLPDYLYTTTILAKGALKKNQEKLVSKAKEEVKEKAKEEASKVIDKVLKDDGKKQQVKKLLKGLF